MIGMASLEVTTNGRGSDHNPLTGRLPFLMLMGDGALLSMTLLGRGTIGRFHRGIAGKGLSHESGSGVELFDDLVTGSSASSRGT